MELFGQVHGGVDKLNTEKITVRGDKKMETMCIDTYLEKSGDERVREIGLSWLEWDCGSRQDWSGGVVDCSRCVLVD